MRKEGKVQGEAVTVKGSPPLKEQVTQEEAMKEPGDEGAWEGRVHQEKDLERQQPTEVRKKSFKKTCQNCTFSKVKPCKSNKVCC